MSIESTLVSRLSTFAGLTAIIVDRVFPQLMPQDVTFPAVSYRLVTGRRPSAMGSDVGVAFERFQISVWAKTFLEVVDTGKQVRLALQRWKTTSGTVVQDTFMEDGSPVDIYEPDTETFQRAFDFTIIYEE